MLRVASVGVYASILQLEAVSRLISGKGRQISAGTAK